MEPSSPSIISSEHDIPHALAEIGLSREVILGIARAAVAGRNEALSVDAASAPGWLSYHFGLRAMRLHLLPRGWRLSRAENLESTVHDDLGVQLLFQNVDIACDITRNPRAISGKGSACRQLVAEAQGELFGTTVTNHGRTPTVWVVCVASDESSVRVEVSCPAAFQGDQFEEFSRRIFVANESFDPDPHPRTSDDEIDDTDVPVFRKSG